MIKQKLIYRVLLILSFVLINTGILYGISQVIAYLNTGADQNSLFNADIAQKQAYTPEVNWLSTSNPGRPMEEGNQKLIEEGYIDAWQARNLAYKLNDSMYLKDHFTLKARRKINPILEGNLTEEIHIESTTISHNLSLEFYSVDGTLVVLKDKNVERIEQIYVTKEFLSEQRFIEDYTVIMLLEDGFWRIRHIERTKSHPDESSNILAPLAIEAIKGINYYPQKTPWDTFGEEMDSNQFEKDFNILRELNMNTVRVFIGYEDFGKSDVSQEKLLKLKTLLDTAEKAHLKVIITLFDFYGDYRVHEWTLTNAHMRQIVTATKDHPALLSWDVKNEPDLDFENRGKTLVMGWLSQSINYLKTLDPNHPVTIGWSNATAGKLLEKEVDYISFHHYHNLDELPKGINLLEDITDKPIVLQEFGKSASRGLWNPLGASRKGQAEFYQDYFDLEKKPIHYLSWTLYDYKDIPNKVAGKLPWRKHKQKYFGIIDADGNKTPAFEVLSKN